MVEKHILYIGSTTICFLFIFHLPKLSDRKYKCCCLIRVDLSACCIIVTCSSLQLQWNESHSSMAGLSLNKAIMGLVALIALAGMVDIASASSSTSYDYMSMLDSLVYGNNEPEDGTILPIQILNNCCECFQRRGNRPWQAIGRSSTIPRHRKHNKYLGKVGQTTKGFFFLGNMPVFIRLMKPCWLGVYYVAGRPRGRRSLVARLPTLIAEDRVGTFSLTNTK